VDRSFRAKFRQFLLLLVLRKAPLGNEKHLNVTINESSSVYIMIQQAISNGKQAKFQAAELPNWWKMGLPCGRVSQTTGIVTLQMIMVTAFTTCFTTL
jgi:hypothetical protein